MRSSMLKAAALATIIAQATLANPDELTPLNPTLLPLGTHIEQDTNLTFDVFYFEAFPCSFGYTDHDAIPSNNCRGFALTVTHADPDAKPTLLWIQSPVQRSILFEWGRMNYRLAAVHWDPDEQVIWLATALTTDAVTFIEVNPLFVQRCADTRSFRITEHGLSAHTLGHEEKQLARVSRLSIEPAPDAGVHVITHHENNATAITAQSIAIKRYSVKTDRPHGSPVNNGMIRDVQGLQPAIHQAIRERQSRTTPPEDPAPSTPPPPKSP